MRHLSEKKKSKKPNQVKTKERRPKMSKPTTGNETPHPYRGRLVGEQIYLDEQTFEDHNVKKVWGFTIKNPENEQINVDDLSEFFATEDNLREALNAARVHFQNYDEPIYILEAPRRRRPLPQVTKGKKPPKLPRQEKLHAELMALGHSVEPDRKKQSKDSKRKQKHKGNAYQESTDGSALRYLSILFD